MRLIDYIRRSLQRFKRRRAPSVKARSRSSEESLKITASSVSSAEGSISELTVKLKFKSKRDREEFLKVDERIQAIALWVSFTTRKFWEYTAVITCVHRTKAEHLRLFRAGKTRIKTSPHMDWRAVDIRLNDLPAKERHAPILVDKINEKFPRRDGYKTAIAHGRGSNYHLHLQVPRQ